MAPTVVLESGCCPAGSGAAAAFEDGGRKAVLLHGDGAGPPGQGDAVDVEGWAWRAADAVGLDRRAVVAGCPVPLAGAAATWARVGDEVASGRWDAVVVAPLPGAGSPAALVEDVELLLRVLDARLDALAPTLDDDPAVAAVVAGLLTLRPDLLALVALARTACAWGSGPAHRRHGCTRTGTLGLPVLAGAGQVPVASLGVTPEPGAVLWWLDLPAGSEPRLHSEEDRLVVRLASDGPGVERGFRLPAALTRCDLTAATVVDDRLEVRFTPDPDAWR